MKKLILIPSLLAVVAWLIGVMSDDDEVSLPERFSDASADREPAVSTAVQERLAYLGDLELAEEVAWYEIVGNNVYIGVKLRGELESLNQPGSVLVPSGAWSWLPCVGR